MLTPNAESSPLMNSVAMTLLGRLEAAGRRSSSGWSGYRRQGRSERCEPESMLEVVERHADADRHLVGQPHGRRSAEVRDLQLEVADHRRYGKQRSARRGAGVPVSWSKNVPDRSRCWPRSWRLRSGRTRRRSATSGTTAETNDRLCVGCPRMCRRRSPFDGVDADVRRRAVEAAGSDERRREVEAAELDADFGPRDVGQAARVGPRAGGIVARAGQRSGHRQAACARVREVELERGHDLVVDLRRRGRYAERGAEQRHHSDCLSQASSPQHPASYAVQARRPGRVATSIRVRSRPPNLTSQGAGANRTDAAARQRPTMAATARSTSKPGMVRRTSTGWPARTERRSLYGCDSPPFSKAS